MFRRLLSVAILLGTMMLVPAGTSIAQSGTDPSAGSPPGVIYELPVDRGRGDAAPRGGAGRGGGSDAGGAAVTGGGGGGSAGEGSFFRSENNFGTSSVVPGDPNANAGAGDGDDANQAVGAAPSAAADLGDTSEAGAIGLIALLVVGGLGIGLIARRSWS